MPDFSVALDGHGAVPAQGPGSGLDGSTCVAFTPSKAMSHVRLRHGSGDFDTMGT